MIYLASPYSHDNSAVRELRFKLACRAAAQLMQSGFHVFSPIAHAHPIAEFGLPKGWGFRKKYDREFVDWCNECAVLCIDGWQESTGVQAEIDLFSQQGKPVVYIGPVDDKDMPSLKRRLQGLLEGA